MAKPSISALALIVCIVSMTLHLPGVDADDAQNNQVDLNSPDPQSFLPGYGDDKLPDDSELGGPAAPMIALEDLDPLEMGPFIDFSDLADPDDSSFDFGDLKK